MKKEQLKYAKQVLEFQEELKELQKIQNPTINEQKLIYNLQYTIEHILNNFL